MNAKELLQNSFKYKMFVYLQVNSSVTELEKHKFIFIGIIQ